MLCIGQQLGLSQILAVLLVDVEPVLLLTLPGAVEGHLALGTLQEAGFVLRLVPAKVNTVEA